MIVLILFVLVVAGALSPVYMFPSGNPQPTDYVFMMLVGIVYFHSIATARGLPLFKLPLSWAGLVVWIIFHCAAYSLVLQSSDFSRTIMFWTYNAAVGSCVIYLIGCGEQCKRYIEYSICLGLVVSGVGVVVSLGDGGRTTGFFNNPNQLAFFSLLGISSLLVLGRMSVSLKPMTVLAVLSGIAGIFSSASLAAISGFCLVVVGYLAANFQPKKMFRVLAVVFVLAAVSFIADDKAIMDIYDNVHNRTQVVDGKFGSISEERNYDRILAFPEYTILGAGEGHLERFYPHDKLEIHSSFGTLLFSYGIPGITLFVVLLYSVLKNAPLPVWIVTAGPLVYSLTHMGLRTTMFWFFIAIIWSEYKGSKDSKVAARLLRGF